MSRRSVFWGSLVLGGLVILLVWVLGTVFEGVALPAGVAALLLVAVVLFVGFVARDEYKVARACGLPVSRAAARALRKTLDAVVLGK